MGSGAMIYVPSFIEIGSGVQKLIRGDTQTHAHGQQRDVISLLYYFKIRKEGEKGIISYSVIVCCLWKIKWTYLLVARLYSVEWFDGS
jgi:hypothetical protein